MQVRSHSPAASESSVLTFPAGLNCPEPAIWTGTHFVSGGKTLGVLSYGASVPGWTDELTQVHEEVAGDDHYIDRASRAHAVEQLRRYLAPGSVVMDIGCSSGFLLRTLQRDLPQLRLIGADCVQQPLEALAKTLPNVPLLRFDLLECPLPAALVDGVVLLNVFEHIEDDRAAAQRVHQLLKPGGIAVIEVPAGPDLFDVYDKQLLHFRRYRMPDLVAMLEGIGFEVLEKSHLGFFLYPAFRFVKKRNQRHLSASDEEQRRIVRQNMQQASNSSVMHALMRMEAWARQFVSYPAGIRCLVTCRRR
jgi:SAM-dependent methyltransferase